MPPNWGAGRLLGVLFRTVDLDIPDIAVNNENTHNQGKAPEVTCAAIVRDIYNMCFINTGAHYLKIRSAQLVRYFFSYFRIFPVSRET